MKLAVNYSDALLELLAQNPGLPVDFIKVPTIPFPECWTQFEQGEKRRNLLPHIQQPGVLALGITDPQEQFNPTLVQQILRRAKPPFLSTHIESRLNYFPEYQEYHHQNHPAVFRVLRDHFLKTIARVKEIVDIPLVLENFPYYSWWQHFKTGSEPQLITEICEAGDCGFLLDIAHARCSAWHFGIDLKAYMDALPLHRLREVHLAGTQIRGREGLRDTHTIIGEVDYEILTYLLRRTDPQIITIEYGGMPEWIWNSGGGLEPISRNDKARLMEMIAKVTAIIGTSL